MANHGNLDPVLAAAFLAVALIGTGLATGSRGLSLSGSSVMVAAVVATLLNL